MKSITFNQALLAVGLIGLTLALTTGWGFVLWVSVRDLAGVGPSIAGPTVVFAIGVVVALAVIVVAAWRMRARTDEHPLTFRELLIVVGVLGLLIALAYSVATVQDLTDEAWRRAATAESGGYRTWEVRQYLTQFLDPWNGSVLLSDTAMLQGLALIVPLLVGGVGIWRRRREAQTPGGRPEPPRPADILVALSLLGLMAALVAASWVLARTLYERELSTNWGFFPTYLGLFAAGPGVPIVALGVLLGWRRTRFGDGFSPVLLAIAGLVGLTTCMAVHPDTVLLALVIFLFLAGLTWWRDLGAEAEGRRGGGLPTGRVIAGVAGLGLVIAFVSAPDISVFLWLLAYGPLVAGLSPWLVIVTPVLAFVMQLALLGVAIAGPWQRAAGSEGAGTP